MFSYRYNSALLPEKGNILTYWIRISKPIFRRMVFPVLLQTVFAAYLGSRQYKVLIKALQLPEPGLEIQWLSKCIHKNKTVKLPMSNVWINIQTCNWSQGKILRPTTKDYTWQWEDNASKGYQIKSLDFSSLHRMVSSTSLALLLYIRQLPVTGKTNHEAVFTEELIKSKKEWEWLEAGGREYQYIRANVTSTSFFQFSVSIDINP